MASQQALELTLTSPTGVDKYTGQPAYALLLQLVRRLYAATGVPVVRKAQEPIAFALPATDTQPARSWSAVINYNMRADASGIQLSDANGTGCGCQHNQQV